MTLFIYNLSFMLFWCVLLPQVAPSNEGVATLWPGKKHSNIEAFSIKVSTVTTVATIYISRMRQMQYHLSNPHLYIYMYIFVCVAQKVVAVATVEKMLYHAGLPTSGCIGSPRNSSSGGMLFARERLAQMTRRLTPEMRFCVWERFFPSESVFVAM